MENDSTISEWRQSNKHNFPSKNQPIFGTSSLLSRVSKSRVLKFGLQVLWHVLCIWKGLVEHRQRMAPNSSETCGGKRMKQTLKVCSGEIVFSNQQKKHVHLKSQPSKCCLPNDKPFVDASGLATKPMSTKGKPKINTSSCPQVESADKVQLKSWKNLWLIGCVAVMMFSKFDFTLLMNRLKKVELWPVKHWHVYSLEIQSYHCWCFILLFVFISGAIPFKLRRDNLW